MKKIYQGMLIVFASLALTFSIAPGALAATGCGAVDGSKKQVLQGVGQAGSNCNDKGVENTIRAVVNILSYIIGAVAVIMIMVGGFKYITSGGSAEGVGNAKNTIIYALVGLAIAVLAQVLVQFVLGQAANAV